MSSRAEKAKRARKRKAWHRAIYIRRARRLLIVIEGLGVLVGAILVLAVVAPK